MNYKLKASIFCHLLLVCSCVMPVLTGVIISILGMCFWNWEGKAAIVIISSIVISIMLGIITFGFIDDNDSLIEEWFKEETKTNPKPNAWKE